MLESFTRELEGNQEPKRLALPIEETAIVPLGCKSEGNVEQQKLLEMPFAKD